jgi:hypothetical protein
MRNWQHSIINEQEKMKTQHIIIHSVITQNRQNSLIQIQYLELKENFQNGLLVFIHKDFHIFKDHRTGNMLIWGT